MHMVVPPPPMPPPGMGEILASHNQMRAQLQQMAHHVHEQSNRAMQLEQRLMMQERVRERSREERRHSAVAMFRQENAAHEVAPPFLNQIIGPAAVPPPVTPPVTDAGMSSGSQEKRASSAPAEQRPKTQVVERVVERLIERPADIARPGVPDPPPMAPVRYDPPKAISEVMPYTHASDPALARAVAHVVASLAAAPKRAAAEDIEEETQEADQSGSKPIVAKKMRADEQQVPKKVAKVKAPTRYTTMSRFNASELLKRREQRRRAVEERRGERAAVRIAKEEALKIVGKVIQKTKARKLATTARMTPSRRAAVVV